MKYNTTQYLYIKGAAPIEAADEVGEIVKDTEIVLDNNDEAARVRAGNEGIMDTQILCRRGKVKGPNKHILWCLTRTYQPGEARGWHGPH